MADDWVSVADAAPPADDWAPVAQAAPVTAGGGRNMLPLAAQVAPHVERIMEAFGHGFREGFGPERLGLSNESARWLSEKKIFGPARGGYDNPLQAANELLFDTVAGAADLAARGASGAFRGAQAAVFTGLGEGPFARDIAAIPEAFFGSPHPTGIPREVNVTPRIPEMKPTDLQPPANLSPEVPALVVARKMPDGEIKYGAKGDIHADLMTKDELKTGRDSPEVGNSMGFALPGGKFLTRDEALQFAERNEPERAAWSAQQPEFGLDAATYNEATKPREPMIDQARELGVIGPEKPSPAVGTPAEAAAREVPTAQAAARTGDDVLRGPEPEGPPKAGNIRLDQIGINQDAHEVILEAAKNNDDFNQARAGDVPLAQVERLAGASGVPSETLSGNDGLGRLMHNDAVVRTWLTAFHQGSDEIAAQLAKVRATGDEADIAKLREMKLRFQHMQEQVAGLTAEAGRTLRVYREFYESKGKAEAMGKLLEDHPGNDADSLKKLADVAGTLDPRTQLLRFLHDATKPTWWDKYLYYWVNALISGPITHTKYIGANAAFGLYEAGVVTPIAGALGTARRALTGGTEGVFMGEAAARTWGLLAGTPDALKAAWTAARENIMTPLPGEAASAKAVNPLTQLKVAPIGGKVGYALGIPGRSAAGIHTFFRFLGYRAEIEAQAYRAAAKEGLSPLDGDAFWQRRAALADNPSEAAIDAGIDNGNHLTFIGEMGSFGKMISKAANAKMGPWGGMQPLKLILPFTHIPGQILRAGLEQTPAAFLDTKMRADLMGRNGAVAADTARARLVAGGAVSAMVANWAVNDNITGFGPTDPSERARWLRSHEPYSVRLGGWWYSYNKFGPIGTLVGLVANLVEVGPKVKEAEYAEAAGHVIKATARMLEDEVGMQGLVNLIDALGDPDHKMSRLVAGQAASNLPYSSLLRQTASVTDPYMREAKTFVDQLRYQVPYARQELLPKRDWLGQPERNPGYGSIIRQREVNTDPIDLEVAQLRGFKPAPPQARIGGVALPPKMYDEYQATAGAMTRVALERMVTAPGWGEMPPGIREQILHATVESMRKTAGAMTQARHPELITQGLQDRQDKIQGVKKTKLKD